MNAVEAALVPAVWMMLLANRLRPRVLKAVRLRKMAPRKAETTLMFGPIPNFRTTYGYDPATSEETKNAPTTDCQVISGTGGATNCGASSPSKSPANCVMRSLLVVDLTR